MKFWNKIENDIFIFGDISGEKIFDSDVTAKEFATDLNACKGPVTVHINSNGGDCFTALAISNLIKSSKNFVTVSIEGICASAATIISSAGHKVIMAENALMMIHLPSVGLCDFYDKQELEKLQSYLEKVESSIIETYKSRTGLDDAKLTQLIAEETWLTASEAKELNFIDEIVGAVEQEVDNAKKLIIFNKVTLNQKYYPKAKEKLAVDKTLFEKFKDFLEGSKPEKVDNIALMQERERIKALQNLRCDNAAVDKIVDVAIAEGASVAEVQKYIDALKTVDFEGLAQKMFAQFLQDNLTSGAEGVTGSTVEDKAQAEADLIASFANGIKN